MPMTPDQQEYYSFIEEYADFLERMLNDEKSKFSALQSKSLTKIEHSIAVSQANAKQLENYETKRTSIQTRLGYENQSFREIVEAFPKEAKSSFLQLYKRFEGSVNEIRFHNDKSMAVARDNMLSIDPSSVLPGASHSASKGKAGNPYSKMKQEQDEQINILETKI